MVDPVAEAKALYNTVVQANIPHLLGIYSGNRRDGTVGIDPRMILQQIQEVAATAQPGTPIDWTQAVTQWHNAQPHPQNPTLTVGEYSTAVELATRTKFGGHASPQEAGAFMQEFKQANQQLSAQGKPTISATEYRQLIDQVAPVSAALHGRPPSMNEIVKLRDSTPAQQRSYFEDLPDSLFPSITAGQMAKYLTIGNFHAQATLGRVAAKSEAAFFAAGSQTADQIKSYFQQFKDQSQMHGPGVPGATATDRSGQNIGNRQPTSGWGGGAAPTAPVTDVPKEDKAGGTQTGG